MESLALDVCGIYEGIRVRSLPRHRDIYMVVKIYTSFRVKNSLFSKFSTASVGYITEGSFFFRKNAKMSRIIARFFTFTAMLYILNKWRP